MNSNSLLNRAKVFFYSIIISIMSSINRLRADSEGVVNGTIQASIGDGSGTSGIITVTSNSILKINWKNIGHGILTLTIWILMGFAAGFLIGMITPR